MKRSDDLNIDRDKQKRVVFEIIERLNGRDRGILQNTLKSPNREMHERGLSILLSVATDEELSSLGIGLARSKPEPMWLVAISPDEDPADKRITLPMELALITNGLPILCSGYGGMVSLYAYPSNFIAAQRQLLRVATNESISVWTLKL